METTTKASNDANKDTNRTANMQTKTTAANDVFKLPLDIYSQSFALSLILGELKKFKSDVEPSLFGAEGTEISVLIASSHQTELNGFLESHSTGIKVTTLATKDIGSSSNKVTAFPFSDSQFDVVIAAELLEHMPEIERTLALEELHRVSKNYIIVSAPFKKNYNESIENIIRQQYLENAGSPHSRLIDHQRFGLPDEDKLKLWLKQKELNYNAYGEGNVINWMLQQLITGAKVGEPFAADLSGFQEYANSHFDEIGNFKEPTYRTIYCIAKGGELPKEQIKNSIEQHNQWSIKTFSYLLKVAFTEQRKLLNRRKKEIKNLSTKLVEVEAGKLSTQANFAELEAKKEKLLNLAKEEKEAILFLRAVLQEKSAALEEIQNNYHELKAICGSQENFIAEVQAKLSFVEHAFAASRKEYETVNCDLNKAQNSIQEKNNLLTQRDLELAQANLNLAELQEKYNDQKKSLDKILASRWWKIAIFFSGIKGAVSRMPSKLLKKDFVPNENGLTKDRLKQIIKEQEAFAYKPIISFILPVYNLSEEKLTTIIQSIKKQTYPRFELCICDDGSDMPHIKSVLTKFAAADNRIKLSLKSKSKGLARATNEALKMATGGYTWIVDDKFTFAPDALFEIVKALQERKYDLLYNDGEEFFGVYRRKILNELQEIRNGLDSSKNRELIKRLSQKTQAARQINKNICNCNDVELMGKTI